jgi:hypothetical protein
MKKRMHDEVEEGEEIEKVEEMDSKRRRLALYGKLK